MLFVNLSYIKKLYSRLHDIKISGYIPTREGNILQNIIIDNSFKVLKDIIYIKHIPSQ